MPTLSSVPEEPKSGSKMESKLPEEYDELDHKIIEALTADIKVHWSFKQRKAVKALINQQIKSVLDELEGETRAYRTHDMRPPFPEAIPLSTIQKIRSRYEQPR